VTSIRNSQARRCAHVIAWCRSAGDRLADDTAGGWSGASSRKKVLAVSFGLVRQTNPLATTWARGRFQKEQDLRFRAAVEWINVGNPVVEALRVPNLLDEPDQVVHVRPRGQGRVRRVVYQYSGLLSASTHEDMPLIG
jgi:hypothetical protein